MRIRSKRSRNRADSLPVILTALLAISGGFLLIWVSWTLEDIHDESVTSRSQNGGKSEDVDTGRNAQNADTPPIRMASATTIPFLTGRRSKTLSKGAAEFGLALISVGLIGLILEAPLMSKYFQGKIARSITGRDYLAKLTKPDLEALQADTLRHYWEIEEKDDRPDLLDYCRDQVESFIAEPFREDVHGTFTVKRNSADYYLVEETISYTCRAIRGEIQSEIKWSMQAKEIGKIYKLRIELTMPEEWDVADKKMKRRVEWFEVKLNEKDGTDVNTSGEEPLIATDWISLKYLEWRQPKLQRLTGNRDGYKLDLTQYRKLDKLHVTVQTEYEAPIGRSITWQMTHPTKKVTGVVNFEGLKFYLETFGVCDKNYLPEKKRETESPQTFVYDSWLLPESGFVFHFLPPSDGLS